MSCVCRPYGDAEAANSSGDGLYVVLSDAPAAAQCGLDLQDEIARIDMRQHGLPESMGLRLGIHFGPIFPIHDPVRNALGFMGAHVSKTARIEPITPEGAVYVTKAFAAAITLASSGAHRCEYVGNVPAAKGYGRLKIYSLAPRLGAFANALPDANQPP